MSNELSIGKSSQYITQMNEKTARRSTVPQNITVILPAYNEEVSIGSVVLRTKKYSRRVVVVDAASSDHTVDVAEMAGAEVIRNTKYRGFEFPVKKGIEYAINSELLLFMDISICHNPELIPKILEPIQKESFDIVIGTCFNKSNRLQENVSFLNNRQVGSGPIGFFALSQ